MMAVNNRISLAAVLKWRFIRFLVVGGINTAFGYCMFSAFLWVGLNYALALFFATVLGVFFNFQTTGRLVFGSKNYGLIWRFFCVYGVTYCVNLAGIFILGLAGVGHYAAGALMLAPIVVLSYLLNRRLVFIHD